MQEKNPNYKSNHDSTIKLFFDYSFQPQHVVKAEEETFEDPLSDFVGKSENRIQQRRKRHSSMVQDEMGLHKQKVINGQIEMFEKKREKGE